MAELVLTKEQQAVVDDRGGALLVSAAAGSGKTKVLVDRVLARVADASENRNIDDYLMITFTQAAAAELRGKLTAALSRLLVKRPGDRHLQRQMSRVYLAQISTVHAFCGTLLKEYAHALDLPADFRICDEQEADVLRERAMKTVLEKAYASVGETPNVAAALDMLGAGRDDRAMPDLILKIYSAMQCYKDPAERLSECRRMLDVSDCGDAGNTLWGAYLINGLGEYLETCIASMKELCRSVDASESLQPYSPTFHDNLRSLEKLASARSWEEVRSSKPDFGKLAAIKKCSEPEEQNRVKAGRKRIIEGVRKRMERFSVSSEGALQDLAAGGQALDGLLTLAEEFSDAYRGEKRRRHVLDYNDLEHETLRLLLRKDGTPTGAAREISQRYAEIMVDEYQDTNAVQDAIFRAISREEQNLFFVGDVKQSIYRFRLADPSIFLEKYKTFPSYTEAKEGQPRKVLLSDNFRSHPEILDAANAVFRMTMSERVGGLRYGDAEALRPQRVMADMGVPAVELHCVDMQNIPQQPPVERGEIEAEFVAERIASMLRGEEQIPEENGLRKIRPEDIVILMRSLSGKASRYMDALRRRGIASVCGAEDIFSTEEIHFLIALLQVIDNPHQDIPLLTVLFSPVFGFSADTVAAIRADDRKSDLYEALKQDARGAQFCQTLDALRDRVPFLPLRSFLDELDELLNLRPIFCAMEGGVQRGRNLDAFFALADNYEKGDRHGLNGFVRYLEGVREKGISSEDASVSGAVRLMTVHKSKGLEFPVVFLADLAKGFNHTDARATVLVDKEFGLGCSLFDPKGHIRYPTIARYAIADHIDRENISEEMRVLYVAMTRAKNRMVMTCCDRRLVSKLTDIARDLTNPAPAALVEGADSMAEWILMAAMARTEAGELFACAGNSSCASVSKYPWLIRMHDGLNYLEKPEAGIAEDRQTDDFLLPMPELSYPYPAATAAPTKRTATQLKGRQQDQEILEHAVPQGITLHFPKPYFAQGSKPLTAAERGTALHLAMQYLRFDACTTLEGIRLELRRLEEQRFLTPQQLAAVDESKLYRFFRSEIGQRVLHGKQVVREFKFSILEDGAVYDADLAAEQVLLQGVTDCCIIEDRGLTILDFKTDRVFPGGEYERAEYYRGQLDAYARALSRIFDKPVWDRILYFFATDTAVSV